MRDALHPFNPHDMRVCVVDYDVGNVGSIVTMLGRIGARVSVSRERDDILAADRLVLPGVGAFDDCMANIEAFGLVPVLNEAVIQRRTPILGVCLGAQLMTLRSEEGKKPGLGWIPAELVRFRFDPGERLRVPHMGWNEVRFVLRGHPVLEGLPEPSRFYFVHSYYMKAHDPSWVAGISHYGIDFTSILGKDHIMAVQFHPEKSHKYGMQLYENFVTGAFRC